MGVAQENGEERNGTQMDRALKDFLVKGAEKWGVRRRT